jgi:hypothetical protein
MTVYTYSNATTHAPLPGVTPRPDPALSAWNRHRRVPREALLARVEEKLVRLLSLPQGWDGHRAAPTAPLAAAVLNGILDRLVVDDSATPQITPLADGGVQVEWLVAGESLQVDASPAGDLVLFATDSGGAEIVEGEFNYFQPDPILIDQARVFLEKISHHVENRIASA